jgi:hypothetical protein
MHLTDIVDAYKQLDKTGTDEQMFGGNKESHDQNEACGISAPATGQFETELWKKCE